MLEQAREGFAHLLRLANPAMNQALLADFRARGLEPDAPLVAANLLRRAGDLAGSREVFRTADASLHDWSYIPGGNWSDGGFAIAPLVVIEDFLPPDRMRALHDHACARQEQFRHALATNDNADPSYDPDRRQTLLDFRFELEREFFDGFIRAELAQLGQCLGMPQFAVDRCEIKLSNHVDGGFFKAHADNHSGFGEAGRAITWLYYFASGNAQFSGGDLLVLDSQPVGAGISPVWFSRIEPRPNRFVAFPSWFYHAVTPVRQKRTGDSPFPDMCESCRTTASHGGRNARIAVDVGELVRKYCDDLKRQSGAYSMSENHDHDDRKLAWVTPSIKIVVTVADVAARIGTDLDEDFTGLS